MYEKSRYTAHAVSVVPSCRAAELPSCRAAELPSCRADFGEGVGCQAFNRVLRHIFAVLVGLAFSGLSGFAQFAILPGFLNQPTPPADAYEWSGAAGTEDWEDGANWVGGDSPSELDGAALLFGSAAQGTGPIKVDFGTSFPWLGSLWFEGGRDVTLSYDFDTLWLGYGLSSGDHLIGIFTGKPVGADLWKDWSAVHHSQVNIDADVEIGLFDRPIDTSYDLVIENATRGGLRFNGLFALRDLGGGDNLIIRGHGATNFAGRIEGEADIIVQNAGWLVSWFGGSGYFAGGQLVLSADNSFNPADGVGWYGKLIVDHGVAVVRADGALGSSASGYNAEVRRGGVLAFRSSHRGSDLGVELDYTKDASLSLTGNGVWRSFGSGWTGALHNDGGENLFGGEIDFWGDTGFGSVGGNLTLTGIITGTGSFVKWGGGFITLENADNTWVGQTLLRDGVMRISGSSDALAGGFGGSSGGPNLTFAGGMLEIAVDTDFTRGLGTGEGQVQWLGDGGFSAYGADRTVTLGDDGTGTGSSLVWGSGSFVPTGSRLLLGSSRSDAWLDFTNAIDLGSEQREVHVTRAADDSVYAELSGIISGAGGGLIKSGKGNLWLTNAGNSYTGPTIIRDGVLRGELSDGSNLQFDGIGYFSGNNFWSWETNIYTLINTSFAVYGLDADFTRSVGTGPGQVSWTGNGGFAAYGENRTVMLNNSTTVVVAGVDIPVGAALIFGARDSDATVIWNTALDFPGAAGIGLVKGSDSLPAVHFTQSIVTRNGLFTLYGDGRADFSRDQAISRLDPARPGLKLNIKGGELRLNQQGSLYFERIVVVNGTLTLDNAGTSTSDTGGTYRSNRLPGIEYNGMETGFVDLWTGTLRFLGRRDAGASTDSIHWLWTEGSTFDVVNNRSDNYTELSIMHFRNPFIGTTTQPIYIHFINSDKTNGTYSDSGNNPRLRIVNNQPGLIHGIYTWGIVNELDFATLRNGYIVPYTDYDTSDPEAWTVTNNNASPLVDGTVSGNRSLNSLRLIDGRSIDLAANASLTLRGLLSTGTGENFINGGELTVNNTLYSSTTIHTYAPLTITGKLNYNWLVKAGDSTLTLSGSTSNAVGNFFYIPQGTVVLNKSNGAQALGGRVRVMQSGVLRVEQDNQFHPGTYLELFSSHTNDRATLQFNGAGGRGLTQRVDTLAVQQGMIDFQGGSVGKPNFLIVEVLRPIWGLGRWFTELEVGVIDLWIKNWFEFEDYFLIRRGDAGWLSDMQAFILPHITFEGYGRGARLRDYDSGFYEIVPFPEPTTYGAILGASGLGLVFWRKRKRRRAGSGALAVGRRF